MTARPTIRTLQGLDAAIRGAQRMGLPLSCVLGPVDVAAARDNVRGAGLCDEEAAFLSRMLATAEARGKRSFRLDAATLRGWVRPGCDVAALVARLAERRWFWRVPGQTRDGVWLPDGYHLTFDVLPGRSAPAGDASDAVTADLTLLRPFAVKPGECPVLGAFARAAGIAPPLRARTGADAQHRRALRLVDWAIRGCIPHFFEAIRRDDLARRVRMLPALRTREMARGAVAQAAEVSQSSRVQSLACCYLRASAPDAGERARRLEDRAAAAFAGALAGDAERALGRDIRDEAGRLLFELVVDAWDGAPIPAPSRRPPIRGHADTAARAVAATSGRG